MFPQKSTLDANPEPKTYPLGENGASPHDEVTSALVALSHTPLERLLYEAMLTASQETFTVRRVKEVTEIASLSTIRRGLERLVAKLSIERNTHDYASSPREHPVAYRVVSPHMVLARRTEQGIKGYRTSLEANTGNVSFNRVIQRVVENNHLSRREAQVTLCCVEGLTNAEIASRLLITEQTVKFHLRNIFIKFRVKRRTELISRLLTEF